MKKKMCMWDLFQRFWLASFLLLVIFLQTPGLWADETNSQQSSDWFVPKIIENPEISTAEFKNAIIEDVAVMYQSRGDIQSGSESSMATYRRYSKRPIF